MVFQRGRELRVFGSLEGAKGNSVTSRLKDKETVISEGKTSSVNDDGLFLCVMPPAPAGGPYTLEVSSSEEGADATVLVREVYVGEVWLAGGQSNMEYPLGRTEGAKAVVSSCPDTRIHFCNAAEPKWSVINKDTCYDMSGVAYYFALKLQEYIKDVHIGIIGCYLGGTSASCWQPVSSLEKTPEGRSFLRDYELKCNAWRSPDDYRKAVLDYDNACETYNAKLVPLLEKEPYLTYMEVEDRLGGGPWPPPMGPDSIRRPGALYEKFVLKLAPFSLKGVIFYQGEEDAAEHSKEYAVAFRSLIEQWREVFDAPELPFLFCELPQFTDSSDKTWPELRKQQKLVADNDPHAYMIELADYGEVGNVHPSDKVTPGNRLADSALLNVYRLKR